MAELFRIESNDREIKQRLARYPKQASKAMARTLNKVAKSTRTDISDKIRNRMGYKIKKGDLDKTMKVSRKATSGRLVAVLTAIGKRIPLIKFAAKQTKRGVTVAVRKGAKRLRLPNAFIASVRSRSVFQRIGKARGPLKSLAGPSVPKLIGAKNIIKDILKVAGQKIVKTFRQEFNRERSKGLK